MWYGNGHSYSVFHTLASIKQPERRTPCLKKLPVSFLFFHCISITLQNLLAFRLGLYRSNSIYCPRSWQEWSVCILFLARAHKTIIRGETKERKNEDFGNLLDKKSSVPDLAPICLPFIRIVSTKRTLHLITYHYAFIGFSPSKTLSILLLTMTFLNGDNFPIMIPLQCGKYLHCLNTFSTYPISLITMSTICYCFVNRSKYGSSQRVG